VADLTGTIIAGRYRVEGTIGAGGMAVVYKAFDTRVDTEVAIKVIATENLPPKALERALKRFEREAKSLARLDHPNIVKVMDYGEYEGQPYLVMPYLSGGTLKAKLGKPMPWTDVVELILPMAEALRYAHSEHTIHRDVKPSNIMISRSGHPLLTDFGIAKLLDLEDTVDLTGTSAAVGTPEYMAPEQANARTVDHRADIYSLGIVLYEMATGRKPFVADTPMEVLIMQARDPLPPPRKFAPDLPKPAEQILLKALAKKPDERYQTMNEMYAALKASLAPVGQIANLSTPAKPEPRPRTEQTATISEEPPLREPTISLSQPRPRAAQPWLALGAGGIALALICLAVGGVALYRLLFAPATPTPAPTQRPPTAVPATPVFTAPPELGIDSTWTRPADGMTMLYVPEGSFEMGSNDGSDDEKPVHTVYLDAYWMDMTEVTNAMYEKCVNDGDCDPPQNTSSYTHSSYYGNSQYDDYPVLYVDWNQANAYCQWAGAGLPTEAQWEKAASWDPFTNEKYVYPWGNDFDCKKGNFDDETVRDDYVVPGGANCDGFPDTSPVGSFLSGASPYGLFDMAGNVWEWVADWYSETFYGSSPSSNPLGPSSGQYRVLRGGSWGDYSYIVRSTVRGGVDPSLIYSIVGFRCSRSF
jgi:formylglycine-generating enzyme required for sulfatase activity/tRNA A-37 threonylcarbamoyl transferase component Bud32